MFKLKKYLKPFIVGFVLAFGFLFLQAICDLNLPNYMSNIVNVGIQQNGIEGGAPNYISEKGYNFIQLFMDEKSKNIINNSYEQKYSKDLNHDNLGMKPKYDLKLYVLKSSANKEVVSNEFGIATWTMINTMKNLNINSDSNGVQEQIDITKLYQLENTIKNLDDSIISKSREEAKKLDAMLLDQSAVKMVSSFYDEIGIDITNVQTRYIIKVGLLMLGIALISGISTVIVSYISSIIAASVASNIRKDIFNKVSSFSNAEYDKFSTSSLITRTTNDITQIQMLLTMGIRMICYAPIMGVGGILMALKKSVSMGWIIAVGCIALLSLIMVIFIIVMPKFKKMQILIDKLNLVARETLNGLMVIRAFSTKKFEIKKFANANKDLAKNNLFVNRTMTFMMPTMMLIMNLVTLLVIWVGSHQVEQAAMQVGDMMAFMQYAMQIIMSFLMIAMMFIFIPRAAVSATRIAEVLETDPTILDPIKDKKMDKTKKGTIIFRNVYFKYTTNSGYILEDINLDIKAGETVAFIGATGSGKSTLVNLIPRFYDVNRGEILINGVNVKDIAQKKLRSRIGYVPQKAKLMTGTIASNIKYGNDALNDFELNEVINVAQAAKFISRKDDGIYSEVSQGGSNVSGGQRQRLSIARALAIKPDIYIFDDSFSALDFKTDAILRKELKKYVDGSTVLIVAQRVSSIMDSDQIFVIDEGKIVGHGKHKDLLKNCNIYYEIASSQLSKEELENE